VNCNCQLFGRIKLERKTQEANQSFNIVLIVIHTQLMIDLQSTMKKIINR
jgi:hypothetical protein